MSILKFGRSEYFGSKVNPDKTIDALFDGTNSKISASKLNTFPRELFQNSMDSIEKSIKNGNKHTNKSFRIRRIILDLNDFPINDMKKTFVAGIDFLKEQDTFHSSKGEENYEHNTKAIEMATSAIKALEAKKTEAIIIEDDGIGLSGNSRDDDNHGKSLIINQNQTSKGDDNRGSFGIGKKTAYQASNLFTVYYLTSYKGKKSFIGHTKFWSHKIDGTSFSDECFTGKQIKRVSSYSGDEFPCDWVDLDENDSLNYLRSFDCDGLTTIIPTNELKKDKDWIDDLIYLYAESFSDLIIETGFKIEVIDEINDKIVTLDRKTISNTVKKITNKILKKNQKDSNTLTYLTKYICTDKPIKTVVKNIKHGNNESPVEIKLYKMDGLGNQNSGQPFRFIRGGMMVRDFLMPSGTHLRSSDYGGVIKFIGKKNYWGNIFKNFENPNHDSLNKSKIVQGYNWRLFSEKFLRKINKEIKEMVGEHITSTLSGVEIEFALGNKNNGDSTVKLPDSANRKPTFTLNSQKKKSNTGVPVDGDEEEGGGGGIQGGTNTKIRPGGSIGSGPGSGPGTGGKKSKSNTKIIDIKTKLISKKSIDHKYSIEVNNFIHENTNKIYISQFSLKKQAILSFKIMSITIDEKKLKSSEFTPHKNGNELKYYTIEHIPKKENFKIELTVKEPRNTLTSFKLSTFEKH